MYVYVLEPPFSFFLDVALHSQLKFRQVVLCDHIAMFLLELVQEIPLFSEALHLTLLLSTNHLEQFVL